MTNERIAIEQLARCQFSPASFDKRFARDMAAKPESFVLSPKQREILWRLVVRYRRQLMSNLVAIAQGWLAMPFDQRAFEDALDANPRDWDTRGVYADWLEERGLPLADAQRWMRNIEQAPKLRPAGMSYGPNGDVPINYEWHFYLYEPYDSPMAEKFVARCWFRSRESCEQYIAESWGEVNAKAEA